MNPQREDFITNFGIYSKIQDKLMILGNSENVVVLSAVISFYTGYGNKTPTYYYSEVEYISNKFNSETKKIRRDPDFFVSLENSKPIGTYREYIMIRPKDMELMYMNLLPYFEYIIQNFDKIYQVRDNNKLYVTDEAKSLMIDIGNKPIIFKNGINKNFAEELVPTIEMYLNGKPDNKVSMNFDQVYSFMYFIRRFNFFDYMAAMMNYIGKPPVGTNLIDMTYGQAYNQVVPGTFSDPSKNRLLPEIPQPKERVKGYFMKEKSKE